MSTTPLAYPAFPFHARISRRFFAGLAAWCALITASIAPAQELIVNGGFENPLVPDGTSIFTSDISGWTMDAGPAVQILHHPYSQGGPFDGTQHVELNATTHTVMHQDIATTPGTVYTLSLAFFPRGWREDNAIQVLWGGSLVATLAGSFPDPWRVFAWEIVATGPVTRVTLRDVSRAGAWGAFVDAVSAVPFTTAALPTFSPPAGVFNDYQTITVASRTPNAVIHYTTDGSEPTAASPTILGAGTVAIETSGTTLRAYASRDGLFNSPGKAAAYTLIASTPAIDSASGLTPAAVSLTSATAGANIYYTLDGTDPIPPHGIRYESPFSIEGTATLRAAAIKPGVLVSGIAARAFQPSRIVYVDVPDLILPDGLNGDSLDIDQDGCRDVVFERRFGRVYAYTAWCAALSGYGGYSGLRGPQPIGSLISRAEVFLLYKL